MGGLGRFIVDRAVAEDADVRRVVEIGDAMQLGHRPLASSGRRWWPAARASRNRRSNSDRESVRDRSHARCEAQSRPPIRGRRPARQKVQQGLQDATAIQLHCLVLVAVTHQALVTRHLAFGQEIVALFVEVATVQCLPSEAR